MKYKNIPFTLEALEDNAEFTISKKNNVPVLVSYDNGDTWQLLKQDKTMPIENGKSVSFKSFYPSDIRIKDNDHPFNAYGNVMSLFLSDAFMDEKLVADIQAPNMSCLFQDTNIVDASNLILPSVTLSYRCYDSMFDGCTSLTTAPSVLPATTLADSCYDSMFLDCRSLTAPPKLPATTLADYCYYGMFIGCRSLTEAPELPATILATSCYRRMFEGCASLITPPELPAETLGKYCYSYMFENWY